jgi:hypothetical protein
MKSFMKNFLLILLLSFSPALMAKSHPAPAHIKAHVANCVERDSDGAEIKTCFIDVVLINAFNEAITPNGYSNSFYPDAKEKISFTLRPGFYRLTLFSAHSPGKPTWVMVVAATPGSHIDLKEIPTR